MQDKDMMKDILREQVSNENLQGLASYFGQSPENKPVSEKAKVQLNPAISIPAPLKKKRFSVDLIKVLNDTHDRPASHHDEYGEYKEGTFLHGCNIVVTSLVNGRWNLTVRSDKAISMYEIKAARYKYIPNAVYMTIVLPARETLELFTSANCMQLIEIKVTKPGENIG